MLACNVSPTFCHILNQAELMSAFEAQLTFDTCNILEGVSNVSMLQSSSLKNCIKKVLNSRKDLSPGAAREACLVNDNNAGSVISKQDIIDQIASYGGAPFSMQSLLGDIFPSEVKTNKGLYKLSTGNHAYSRRTESLSIAQRIFPGITFNGSASFTKGGTFQRSLDDEICGDELSLADEDDDDQVLAGDYDDGVLVQADAAEPRARRILAGLGFTKEMQERATKHFSGEFNVPQITQTTI